RLVKMVECVPVNRTGMDVASVKAALRHLKDGRVLGIFPQGGIRRPGEPLEIREGVGLLALRSGATVIPAYISGTRYFDGAGRAGVCGGASGGSALRAAGRSFGVRRSRERPRGVPRGGGGDHAGDLRAGAGRRGARQWQFRFGSSTSRLTKSDTSAAVSLKS